MQAAGSSVTYVIHHQSQMVIIGLCLVFDERMASQTDIILNV